MLRIDISVEIWPQSKFDPMKIIHRIELNQTTFCSLISEFCMRAFVSVKPTISTG